MYNGAQAAQHIHQSTRLAVVTLNSCPLQPTWTQLQGTCISKLLGTARSHSSMGWHHLVMPCLKCNEYQCHILLLLLRRLLLVECPTPD